MDAIFKALNDPARRALLDSLREKDGQTLSELETQLDMTRFGVMKHLRVLEDASLVVARKRGRFKHHYLNAVPLQEVIDRWIDPFLAKPAARAVIDLKTQLEGSTPMTEKPDFVMQTYIRCSQDALWDALTDPGAVGNYHFLGATGAGPLNAPGDVMTMARNGGPAILTHKVLSADPKSRIELTFEPTWDGPDMAASRCVFLIERAGESCRLTLEHYDIPAGQEGVRDGWARIVSGLKTYLESGEPALFTLEGAAE